MRGAVKRFSPRRISARLPKSPSRTFSTYYRGGCPKGGGRRTFCSQRPPILYGGARGGRLGTPNTSQPTGGKEARGNLAEGTRSPAPSGLCAPSSDSFERIPGQNESGPSMPAAKRLTLLAGGRHFSGSAPHSPPGRGTQPGFLALTRCLLRPLRCKKRGLKGRVCPIVSQVPLHLYRWTGCEEVSSCSRFKVRHQRGGFRIVFGKPSKSAAHPPRRLSGGASDGDSREDPSDRCLSRMRVRRRHPASPLSAMQTWEKMLKQIPSGSNVALPSAKMFEVAEMRGERYSRHGSTTRSFFRPAADYRYMKAFVSQRMSDEEELRSRLEQAEANLSTARRASEESVEALKRRVGAEFAAQREELETEYQKQVDEMYFFGYRCYMKKNGIKRDISSIPSGEEESCAASLPNESLSFYWLHSKGGVEGFHLSRVFKTFLSTDDPNLKIRGIPTSVGMTAFVPYARANGVFPVDLLGVAFLEPSTLFPLVAKCGCLQGSLEASHLLYKPWGGSFEASCDTLPHLSSRRPHLVFCPEPLNLLLELP
ncbi:hypothetical protein CK203_030387 [Vitis vinifera]|uniref:Uncharacterized protein n=1 Tax=Vitis vinifera TaxID=29760 RepID=A0A438IW63_VITVI|nr:hypothetical protein CK203_030387 [Vitis vinifera]